MIKFQGELSQKCKKWVLNHESRFAALGGGIAMLPVIGAIIAVGLLWGKIVLLFLILPAMLIVPCLFPPLWKDVLKFLPKAVTVSSEGIEAEVKDGSEYRQLDSVKYVMDYGEWYFIQFYFPHKSRAFICQKDLIVEGSVEEFEKLFEGKIKRKK